MTTNLILAIGIMIIAGFFGGAIAARVKFPRISGYLIVGILLSPSVLHLIPKATIQSLDVVTSIALGIIAYLIGGSLHLESMRKLGKSIAWITPLQSVSPWFLTTLVIAFLAPFILAIPNATFANTYFPMAFVLGAIACATAPAATVAIINEHKAKGPLTTTLLAVVALDDVIAIIAFAIAAGAAQPLVGAYGGFSVYQALILPLLHIVESIAIGAVFGFAAIYVAKLVQIRALLLVVVLGMIMLCIAVTELLGGSLLLANMVVGFIVINKAKRDEMLFVIDDIEAILFTAFFVLAGMHFDLMAVKAAGIMTLLVILCRCTGKYFGVRLGARISGAPDAVKKYLGFALLPKAGVTLGLGLLLWNFFPTPVADIMFNTLLASTIINELFAPPLAKYAILKAGEHNS
ncbi:cation:proton antiporter [Chloroflexota bacterium]